MTPKFHAIVEFTNSGYSAYVKEIEVYTTGKNIEEIGQNLIEAITLYFEPETIKIQASQIQMSFNFEEFFKKYRILNAQFLAKKIQIHPTLLSQYINGKKVVSLKQSEKILRGIHQIGEELANIQWHA